MNQKGLFMRIVAALLLNFIFLAHGQVTVADTAEQTSPTSSKVDDPSVPPKIILHERISFKLPAPSWFANPQEYGLLPGEYEASSKIPDGVFYKGKGRAVWFQNPETNKLITAWPGGIFVPFDKAKTPSMYKVAESRVYNANWDTYEAEYFNSMQGLRGAAIVPAALGSAIGMAIVEAIVASEAGNVHIFNDVKDPVFLEKITKAVQHADAR
jgi:hypothetical protein